MPLPPGAPLAPVLAALAYGASRARFYDRERRLVLAVLAEAPPSARRLAARLRRPYSHVKADVRALLAWGVLVRDSAGGLRVDPDPGRWCAPGPAGSPS
jgi:hypothetical protein